ncbi:MAG TPA: DUF58 domain-containing protein [Rhodocyclaceae bacterium]|jgi:uncharacterized protein (DUF58 family)|nr:DUF58 domain-containing protein [Rhodocyclaceae bacterium]
MITAAWRERYLKPAVVLGLVVVAYAAALNRIQTLPWVIAAALLATAIVGFVWPYWLVSRLDVRRSGPSRAEEGETIVFAVEVENRGWLPRFMVELVDRLPFRSANAGPGEDRVLGIVSYAPARGVSGFSMSMQCEKRGFYRLGPVGLQSSFPLGLAEARVRTNGGVQTLTVYPDVFSIVSLPLQGAPSQIHRGGYLLPKGSGSAEFSGLREYRRGDHPRYIHWPTTAKLNELMVKEFEPLASACLYVMLDLESAANIGAGRRATAEYAIRIAASIAQFCCRNNIRIRMHGEGARALNIAAGSGELHYQRLLDELAVVDVGGKLPYGLLLQHMALNCANGETVVVGISARERDVEPIMEGLAAIRARGAHLLAVVFDRGSFADKEENTRAETERIAARVIGLGAVCVEVKCGDDLARLFNA